MPLKNDVKQVTFSQNRPFLVLSMFFFFGGGGGGLRLFNPFEDVDGIVQASLFESRNSMV